MTLDGIGIDALKALITEQMQDSLLSKVYPVGSIYMSTSNADPSTFIGGTWEAMPEGKVLLAQGASYPAGQEGGEATHTLTTAEMPSHTHSVSGRVSISGSTGSAGSHGHDVEYYQPPSDWTGNTCSMTNTSGNNGFISCLDRPQWERTTGTSWVKKSVHVDNTVNYSRLTTAGSHSHSLSGVSASLSGASASAAGLSQPLSLIQPYIAVYIWQRTA